jgi:hypothetical protein
MTARLLVLIEIMELGFGVFGEAEKRWAMNALCALIPVPGGNLAWSRRLNLVRGFGCDRGMRQRGSAHPAKTILRAVVVPAMGTVYVHSLQHSVKLLMAEKLLALAFGWPRARALL